MTNTTPPPMPNFPPPPPAPKKSRTNAIIIGSAAALIVAIVATGVVVANTDDGDRSDTASSEPSAPADATITPAAEPEPTPEEEPDSEVRALTDGVVYADGVEVRLSEFKRGTSSEYGSPASTPYVSFTVKVVNGSEGITDLGTGYYLCYYGDSSAQGEAIFDSERGLDSMPLVKLRPGRTAKWKMACEMPKGETYLQIEGAPTVDAQVAVFAGNVK